MAYSHFTLLIWSYYVYFYYRLLYDILAEISVESQKIVGFH